MKGRIVGFTIHSRLWHDRLEGLDWLAELGVCVQGDTGICNIIL